MSSDRIIEKVSTEDTMATGLPLIGDLTVMDMMVAYAVPVLIMILGQNAAPPEYQAHVMLLTVIAAFIGTLALIATPDHTPLGQFMSNFWHHKRRPKDVRYRRKDESEDVLERDFLEQDERAQDLTEVKRFYPQHDAIELNDGTMVGAVRVTSANLDTADPDRKNATVQSVKNFFENVLDFDLQIYITTHGFDGESAMAPYRRRLNDEDLKQNPILRYHCQNHIRWVTQRMGGRPIREFYLVVPVTKAEVKEADEDDETVSSSLEAIPVLGAAFGATAEDEHKLTAAEVRLQQLSYLNDRIQTIQSSFVNAIGEEADSERVKSAQFAALLKEYWEGELVNDSDFEELVAELPVKIGEDDPLNNEVN